MSKSIDTQNHRHIAKLAILRLLETLLPEFYKDDRERDLILERLKKEIYYGDATITKQLKAIRFSVDSYPEEQKFLFYLTYLMLVRGPRSFIQKPPRSRDADRYPNRQLVYIFEENKISYDIREVGFQFLIAYDQSMDLKKYLEDLSSNSEEQTQFLYWYCKFLIFMHQDVQEFENMIKEMEESQRELKRDMVQGEEGETTAEQRENSTLLYQMALKNTAFMAEEALRTDYQQEEAYLRKQIKRLYTIKAYDNLVKEVQDQIRDRRSIPHNIIRQRIEKEDFTFFLYEHIFSCRYFVSLSACISYRTFQDTGMPKQLANQLYRILDEEWGRVKGFAQNVLTGYLQKNPLFSFGSRMLFQREISELQYERDLLDALLEEVQIQKGKLWGPDEQEPRELDETTLNGIRKKELFALMIRDEEEREKKKKTNMRNDIRELVKGTIKTMEALRKRYGILSETKSSQHVCAMYEELYLYHQDHKKQKEYKNIIKKIPGKSEWTQMQREAESYLSDLFEQTPDWEKETTQEILDKLKVVEEYQSSMAEQEKQQLSTLEWSSLKEKQIRGLFRHSMHDWKPYQSYIEKRKQTLNRVIELYTCFEDEDKTDG